MSERQRTVGAGLARERAFKTAKSFAGKPCSYKFGVSLEARQLLPDLGFEEQGFTARQADQAVVVLHHFGFDQFALPFNLQSHPGRRAQRTDIPYLGRM